MDTQIHPEVQIRKVKAFITELSFVQNLYIEGLYESLRLTEDGKDWLFYYIFNHTDDGCDTFEEFLKKHGKTFGEMK